MKPIVFLLILCGGVFLICFLIDRLLKKLFPKTELEKSDRVVRMPRKSAVFGLLLILFSVIAVLLWIPPEETALCVGCGVVFLMGIVLLWYYFSFSIHNNDTSFQLRDLAHKKTVFSYGQITAQQSLVTKSGINITLFIGDDTVMLTEAMQGVSEFLSTAFFKWCEQTGTDPDSVKNNPRMLTFFPAPKE